MGEETRSFDENAERALASAGSDSEILRGQATVIADILGRKWDAQVGAMREGVEQMVAERNQALEKRVAELEAELATKAPTANGPKAPPLDQFSVNDYNPLAAGVSEDGKWPAFGEFVRAAVLTNDPNLRIVGDGPKIEAALSADDVSKGGALVPEEYRAQIMQLMVPYQTIRPRAMVIPMGSSTIKLPAVRETDRRNRTRFGGVRAYWTRAGAQLNRSEPAFKQVTLTAKGLKLFTEIESELMQDAAVSLGSMIARMMAEAAAWEEEYTFFQGDGAGEPLGILNSDVMITVAEGGDAAAIDAEDIAAMESRLLVGSDMNSAYWIHPSARRRFITMTNDSVQFMQESLTMRPPMTLLGKPIYVNEFVGRDTQANQAVLADFSKYLIGDRMAFSLGQSTDFLYDTDEIAVRGVCRIDGAPWMDSPVHPFGARPDTDANSDNDTLGPFVALGAG